MEICRCLFNQMALDCIISDMNTKKAKKFEYRYLAG
jgi:hypothetical protein